MYYLALQATTADEAERYEDVMESDSWSNIASTMSSSEKSAKAEILEMLLEMLNDESFIPDNQWVRLAHYNNKATKIMKVEVF